MPVSLQISFSVSLKQGQLNSSKLSRHWSNPVDTRGLVGRLGQSIGFSWKRALKGAKRNRVWKDGDSPAPMQCKAVVRHCKSSPEDMDIYIYTHIKHTNKKDVDRLERVERRPWRCSEGWSTSAAETGWENWGCFTWRMDGLGNPLEPLPIHKELQETTRRDRTSDKDMER